MNGTAARGLRIVRLANFVAPASGGLRTALCELGRGYRAAGHEPVLIVPGEHADDRETRQGRVITLPAPPLPGTGGYRVLTGRRRLARLLEELAPDRLEVSDRTTLRWTGAWARYHRVPAVMVSHETADGVLRTWGLPEAAARRAADALNIRTAHAYARVVCTTGFAEREFARIGARNVVRAPLGVDLAARHPGLRDAALRARHAREAETLLVMCSRLSVEKRPGTALDALSVLRRRAVLVWPGTGRCAPGWSGGRGSGRCPSPSSVMSATAVCSVRCRRPPTSASHRAPPRPSGSPRWRRWRAGRPWWPAPPPPCPR
jgi:alpha-1,6-mannosyltransferase